MDASAGWSVHGVVEQLEATAEAMLREAGQEDDVFPALVRVRGPEEWVWPNEATLRRWVRGRAPSVLETRLTNDPRRVVLDSEDVAEAEGA